MSTLREAAEMALEALEYGHFAVADQAPHADVMAYLEATDKLREALAQPEPEPVAWMDSDGDVYPMPETEGWRPPHTLLYTHPPKREPLTDEEISLITASVPLKLSSEFVLNIARAIERAHGIGGEE